MRPRGFWSCMRTIFLVTVTALLAGCASTDPFAPQDPTPPAGGALATSKALEAQGVYWIPTSVGMSTSLGDVPFRLDSSGSHVTITLRVGSRAAGVEAPASSAMVMAKLVDSTNKTVAEAMIMPPENEATIETTNATAGPWRLVLGTRGGSDGKENGDYVAYAITAMPRQT